MLATFEKHKKFLLTLEGMFLIAALIAFWFPSNHPGPTPFEPIDRAKFIWLFIPIIITALIRSTLTGQFWTGTSIDLWMKFLLLISAANVFIAAYETRGFFMLARPILGILCISYLSGFGKHRSYIEHIHMGMLLFACAIGFIALGTTEWIEKSYVFRNIIFILPRFDLYPFITTFNSNEIGGALAWLIPYCGGMIVYPWRNTVKAKQAISVIAFITTFTAAILGQSRFAIIGVLISLFVLVFTLFPKGRIQFYTAASLMIITILQTGLIFSRLSPKNTGNFPRDEISFNNRFDIWNSAFKIIRDHPLTGAGMNNFRIKAVRRDYPVPKYDFDLLPGQTSPRILPHTHNEMLQMGTDFGIPGIILFIGLYFSIGKVLWHCWNSSNTSIRSASIILGASLFAHAFFGLGDAIPIWDRFHFIQWIMIGLLCAHFRLNTIQIFQPQKLT